MQGMPSPVQRPRAQTRPSQTRPALRRFGSFDWRAMAASIVLSAALASGATQWLMLRDTSDSLAVAIASGHRRSLLATSPDDVVSSDRHTIKPWLDARIGVSPPAPDLAKDGFALLGGRVEVIGDQPMPALVYRHHEHLITLVAAPRETGSVSVPVANDLSAGGFSLVHWSDGAFSYWAISDTERPVLDDFVSRFRAAIVAGWIFPRWIVKFEPGRDQNGMPSGGCAGVLAMPALLVHRQCWPSSFRPRRKAIGSRATHEGPGQCASSGSPEKAAATRAPTGAPAAAGSSQGMPGR